MQRKIIHLLAVLTLTLSCSRDYVTGKRTFNLITEDQEVAMGREADPQILAEYGVYEDEQLTAWLAGIGEEIARVSHRPNLKYTFRIVDSPVVNAFALPGGWVYFTRGILAHFNSEDELAGVLGHEVGHIVARHGAEQLSRTQLAMLGINLGSLFSERFSRFSGLAETTVSLLFLKFSRDQESESDVLGVEYATRLGYDAHKMANFFHTIARLSQKSGSALPGFLSTHPNPENREERVHQLTEEWRQKVAFQPRKTSRAAYLRRINGIIYGQDPRQGFVENDMFYHPVMRFKFPLPQGWSVNNTPRMVQIVSPQQDAVIQFQLADAATPDEAADTFLASTRQTVISRDDRRLRGFPAVSLETKIASETESLRVQAWFIQKDNRVFAFYGFCASENYKKFQPQFTRTMRGFNRETNPSVLNRKPKRVRIRTVPAQGSFEFVMRRLGVRGKAIDELALLNGVERDTVMKKGDLVKTISE